MASVLALMQLRTAAVQACSYGTDENAADDVAQSVKTADLMIVGIVTDEHRTRGALYTSTVAPSAVFKGDAAREPITVSGLGGQAGECPRARLEEGERVLLLLRRAADSSWQLNGTYGKVLLQGTIAFAQSGGTAVPLSDVDTTIRRLGAEAGADPSRIETAIATAHALPAGAASSNHRLQWSFAAIAILCGAITLVLIARHRGASNSESKDC
ncbi:MAG TPA: hypothetical protein VFY10_03835 [Dehalococcoidia bacterium]|nr:hypothetical protein [Dehalococcoidia bacterium]